MKTHHIQIHTYPSHSQNIRHCQSLKICLCPSIPLTTPTCRRRRHRPDRRRRLSSAMQLSSMVLSRRCPMRHRLCLSLLQRAVKYHVPSGSGLYLVATKVAPRYKAHTVLLRCLGAITYDSPCIDVPRGSDVAADVVSRLRIPLCCDSP